MTTVAFAPRAVPTAFAFGSKRSLHLIERNLLAYRRTWIILVSGVFEPVFYLLSIGVGRVGWAAGG